MPQTGAVQDGDYFHGGSTSYMGFRESDWIILKDYGSMTVLEWDEAGGNDQWYRDFPPVEASVEEIDREREAWIGPNGEFYLCWYANHESEAKRICNHLGIKDPEKMWCRSGDLLKDRKWARVYRTMLWADFEYSQGQINTLSDLLVVLQKQGDWEKLIHHVRLALGLEDDYED